MASSPTLLVFGRDFDHLSRARAGPHRVGKLCGADQQSQSLASHAMKTSMPGVVAMALAANLPDRLLGLDKQFDASLEF